MSEVMVCGAGAALEPKLTSQKCGQQWALLWDSARTPAGGVLLPLHRIRELGGC